MRSWPIAGLGLAAMVAAWLLFGGTADDTTGPGAPPDRPDAPVAPRPTQPPSPAPRAARPAPDRVDPAPSEPEPPPPLDEEPPEELERVAELDVPPAAGATVWPLDGDGLMGAVREAMPTLQACYEDALAVVPDLEGRLLTQLHIEERDGIGHVAGVVIETEIDDVPLEDCMLDALERLQFDPPEETVIVRYPFQFRVEDEP